MRNFERIASGVNVAPLAHALQRKPHLWGADKSRTTFPGTPHIEVDDILLRFECLDGPIEPGDPDFLAKFEKAERVFQPAWRDLPEVKPIILPLMMSVGAYDVGRLIITRLAPGKTILPHRDVECYAQLPDIARYHIVIQGLPGSLFYCGGEEVQMMTGEVWWFRANEVHTVINNSVDDRIHLLVDLRIM